MTYLISDIHGMFYTFTSLLDKIQYNDPDCSFVFVGDYIDGGLHSFQVVEKLIDLQKQGHVMLRGNHDDYFDLHISGKNEGNSNPMLNFDAFGFDKTLPSYGVLDDDNPVRSIIHLRDAVPQSHKDFFRCLKTFWQNDSHFACHAFMDPSKKPCFATDRKHISEAIEGRFTSFDTHWDKIGVFGHISGPSYRLSFPYKINNIRIIDNGGIHGESLLAYCCETDEYFQETLHKEDLTYIL